MAVYTVESLIRRGAEKRVYSYDGSVYYFSHNSAQVGHSYTTDFKTWRTLTEFNALPDSITDSTGSVKSINIKFDIKSVYCYDTALKVRLRIPTAKYTTSMTNKTLYEICTGGTSLTDEIVVSKNETYSGMLSITNSSRIALVLERGIAVDYTTDSSNASSNRNTYVYGDVIFTSVEIEYENLSTAPEVSLPAGTPFESKGGITEPFLLKWTYSQLSNSPQKAIDMDIRTGDDSFVNLLDNYPLTVSEYLISPDKFPAPYAINNEVYIRLRAHSAAGAASEYTATYIILIFPQLNNLSPGNAEIKLSSEVIRLSWNIYAVDSVGTQYDITNYPIEFEIQYSSNSGESWNSLGEKITAVREGNSYYYDVPSNFFSNGIITWRVRPYVNGYTINEYVQETFIVRAQASTSSVTCDGKPLPTVSWQSSAQIAYQVRFADYDSGARYGSETSFTVPYFYTDGYYPVQVRTQASDGAWSAWTEMQYVQITNTVQANSITLTAGHTRHAVVLQWIDSGTSENYVVYRNHMPVYIGTDTSFTDIAANGKCTYYVRAIQPSRNYSQSNTVILDVYPKTDCVYVFSSMQWIPLKYSLQDRSRNYSKSADVIYMNYAGRDKPVAFLSGHTVRQMSGSYVFKTEEEALRIQNAAGKTVIFKDTRGGKIIGILNNANITVLKKLYAVTFIVTETDYIEEKEYAAE